MSPTLIILCSVIGLASGVGVLPDSVNAAVGDTVTFTTSLAPTETPLASLIWSFEDVSFVSLDFTDPQYQDRITLFNSTGSLELRNLALSDAGVYSVTIQPAGGKPETGRTTLNIYEPVSDVSVTATNTDLVEFNDTVTLSCSSSGSPQSFLWFNGSAEVKASDRVQFTNGGANVTIAPVLRYDNGSYSCKVSYPDSSSTSDQIPLSVSYGPDTVKLDTSPSGEHHAKGSTVILSCIADSNPPAQFRWFLDERKLFYTDAVVRLWNIQVAESGKYRCEAFNNKTLRDISSQPAPISVWLTIQNPFVLPSPAPFEGMTMNLTCDATGSILTREWMINGTDIKSSENIEFYDEKQVLSFRNVTRKDNGIYTCIIGNPVSNQSADFTLKAIYGPENITISGPVEVQEGETLKLSCSTDCGPTALYIWTKDDGTYLVQSHEYVKERISLSDSGVYNCEATNEITMSTSRGSIEVFVVWSGLSGGVIAGITIAVVVVVTGAAAGGFYLHKRK